VVVVVVVLDVPVVDVPVLPVCAATLIASASTDNITHFVLIVVAPNDVEARTPRGLSLE